MSDLQGHGTVIEFAHASSFASSTTIGVVTNISGPNETADSLETTDFDSDAAEFSPGLKEPGDMQLDLKYYATNAAAVRVIEARSDSTNPIGFFRVKFNDHTTDGDKTTWACAGAITNLGHTIPFDDMVKQTVTIKFSGPSTASFDS